MRLERLTYVHDGEVGPMGQLIAETRGVLKFGGEGSGLLEVARIAPSVGAPSGPEVSVRITSAAWSTLPDDLREQIGARQVPCVLGHSGANTVVLLPPRSVARVTGGLSDLRGKVRYGLARIGWLL